MNRKRPPFSSWFGTLGLGWFDTNQMNNYTLEVKQVNGKWSILFVFDMFFCHEILPDSHIWVPGGQNAWMMVAGSCQPRYWGLWARGATYSWEQRLGWNIFQNLGLFRWFPTCQVRVVRFYQSCSPPPPPPPHPPPPPPPPPPPCTPDPSGHSRTSTASARSQWALPDLHRELKIPVGTAGPQPRLPGCSGHCRTSTATSDRSGHCRASTATSRSQWALPDLNGKNVRKDVR